MSQSDDQKRKEYLEERKLLIDWEHGATTSFDKAMLTLSSGALVLSLTYLKELGGPSSSRWALHGCWISFGLSILFTTWSFLLSQHGLRRQREILDSRESANRAPDPRSDRNYWASVTNCFNWGSVVSFTLGVCCLAIYAISGVDTKDTS
jgi:hypothetical protein